MEMEVLVCIVLWAHFTNMDLVLIALLLVNHVLLLIHALPAFLPLSYLPQLVLLAFKDALLVIHTALLNVFHASQAFTQMTTCVFNVHTSAQNALLTHHALPVLPLFYSQTANVFYLALPLVYLANPMTKATAYLASQDTPLMQPVVQKTYPAIKLLPVPNVLPLTTFLIPQIAFHALNRVMNVLKIIAFSAWRVMICLWVSAMRRVLTISVEIVLQQNISETMNN